MENLANLSVESMILLQNELEGLIVARREAMKSSIVGKLTEEICNYLDCVGSSYVESDYYAGDRYYSSIDGIKNIRGSQTHIVVKLTKDVPLPSSLIIRGVTVEIVATQSKNYTNKIDY